jgi:polar amino acid transport system substrate-binding protein
MRPRIKPAAWIAAIVCAALLAGAPRPALAQVHTLDQILSAKKLVVGVNPTLPPLASMNDKNEIVGYDVDIAQKLGAMLGVPVELVTVGSPDRVPFVATGKVDIVMGALTRNPDRAKVIDFTVPIQTEALSVLTTEPKPFASWQDLNKGSVTLVQVRGTTPLDFIKASVPQAKLLLLDNYPDAVRALAQGRADAMIDVVDYLGNFTKNYQVQWKILKQPIGGVDYDSIGVAKGNDTLRNWLNIALFSLSENGFMAATYKKWFGIDMVVPIVANPYF